MKMTRAEFLYTLLTAPFAMSTNSLGNRPHLSKPSPPQERATAPKISPMLYGSLRSGTNLESWFQKLSAWGVQKWMTYPFPFHPRYDHDIPGVVPFLGNFSPEFTPYLNVEELRPQEELLLRQVKLCEDHGIDFWYLLPFPTFPVRERAVAEKAVPYLFSSGKLNLYDPRLAEFVKIQIRSLKTAIPSLRGINIWFAEGAGGLADFTQQDLARNQEWQRPIVQAFDDITRELKMEGIVFAHHYLLTVGMRRKIYAMMADFPQTGIMEDITWPEEDLQHPFLGYLPREDKESLVQVNPVDLNFLLDTEYVGQGVLPSVYPRWWKRNLSEAVRMGAKVAMGRTFFWDGGYTDLNFNRLNAHIFTRLCYQPEADARELLDAAARDAFGDRISSQLVDLLWETEPVLTGIVAINGIDTLDHSSFPLPENIDVLYLSRTTPMKGIDDLFEPSGSVLYPKLTDDLNNYKQWRWQDQTVSRPAETYIAEKKAALEWTRRAIPKVKDLSAALSPQDRDLFVYGYELMAILAEGMQIFVESAALHYAWAHAKTLDDKDAQIQFGSLSDRFRVLAATVPQNPFSYRERMLAFAEFLENSLPRLSKRPL